MKQITTNNRPSFLLYKSFYAPIKHLKDDELGLLFRTLFDYQNGLEIENLPSQICMAFAFFKNQFDLDEQKYQITVDRNKSNGSKGGRPKKEETQANPENPVGFLEPKKAEKEKEKEIEKDKRKRFSPPTLQEVSNYCKERNNSVNPNKFLNYYESNGWKVGKNSMKDWKACVRTWEQSDFTQDNTPSAQQPDNFCQSLNQILGQQLIKNLIEGEVITIKLASASANDKWDSLSPELKNQILEKVKAKFGKNTKVSF